MKTIKKKIAIITALCMVVTLSMPVNSKAASVSDISNHWAKTTIQSWIENDLISGYPDGSFKPDNNIKRAEFMTLVNKAFAFTSQAAISFSDVTADAWYFAAVKEAVAAGYISGYPDGTMRPDNPITREEVASIILKIKMLEENVDAANDFSDAMRMTWSKGAIGAISRANIMNGYPGGSFIPQDYIKRCEAVVSLDKANKYINIPPAPTVVGDDVKDTVTGMTSLMEYKLDSAEWVPYDATTFEKLKFSGNHTFLVRFLATDSIPFSQTTTLIFTEGVPLAILPSGGGGGSSGGGSSGGGGSNPPAAIAVNAISVTSITSATTISTNQGELQMVADAQPANATNRSVEWSIVSGGSGDATISMTGLLTAVKNGVVTVKATSVSTPSVNGTLVITISGQESTVVPIDASALIASIEAALAIYYPALEGISVGRYVVGSKVPFGNAIDAAIVVKENLSATQEQVDDAKSELDIAIASFNSNRILAVSLADLAAATAAAIDLYDSADEGTTPGTYEMNSMAPFKTVIDAANMIGLTSTQDEINKAAADLESEEAIFKEAKIAASKILFTFDDTYTDALAAEGILTQKGFKGTAYIVRDFIKDYSFQDDMMTLAEIQGLYAAEWDIANHSKTHFSGIPEAQDLSSVTAPASIAAIAADYIDNQNFLLSQNMTRGALNVAYAFGESNPALIAELISNGAITGRDVWRGYQPWSDITYFRLNAQGVGSDNLGVVLEEIDNAVDYGSTIILMIHKIRANPSGGEQTSPEDFEHIVNYVKEHSMNGEIDVMTISEWYDYSLTI